MPSCGDWSAWTPSDTLRLLSGHIWHSHFTTPLAHRTGSQPAGQTVFRPPPVHSLFLPSSPFLPPPFSFPSSAARPPVSYASGACVSRERNRWHTGSSLLRIDVSEINAFLCTEFMRLRRFLLPLLLAMPAALPGLGVGLPRGRPRAERRPVLSLRPSIRW